MTINVSHRIIGGIVVSIDGSGSDPLPWLLFKVLVQGATWDRTGKRAYVPFKERVIVQGEANITALSWITQGAEVLITGVGLPAFCVVNDREIKGQLTLAQTVQRPGDRE